MKIAHGVIIVVIGVLSCTAMAGNWTGNINGIIGAKLLDEDDWEPAEEHAEFGVLADFRKDTWPVSIAVDLLYSTGDGTGVDRFTGRVIDLDGETAELDAGIRKVWDGFTSVRPYIGGGVALISADVSATAEGVTVSDDDNDVGFWISGGVYWTIGTSFNIGFDVRYSQAEVTLFDTDAEAGGIHSGLLLGFHW